MDTRITRLIGTKYPIIMGGMAWIGDAGLAAAVCKAGGLGVLGAATMSPSELASAIGSLRDRGIDRFGVNISLVDPGYIDLVPVLVKEKVPVVTVSGGSPDRVTTMLKDAGCTVMHVVPSARLAEKAANAGVDAVIAEGFEAGGHVGIQEIPTFVLVPMVRQAVDLPVVAAGGVASGRAIAAAFCLGAEGVQIGTLFAAAAESPACVAYKKMVFESKEMDIVVYSRKFEPARAIRTPAVDRILALETDCADLDQIVEARGLGRAEIGLLQGDVENGLFPAGLSAAQVEGPKTVKEIFDGLLEGYRQAGKELPHGED